MKKEQEGLWLNIECIKDVDDLGYADFIKGNLYQVESIDEKDNTCYVISEDGPSCEFKLDEIPMYFNFNIN